MSKVYRNLWPELVSFENLWTAFKKAARGKRSNGAVAAFEFDLENNLFELQEKLSKRTYQPGGYDSFYIHDPKKRLISAALFRDRVVHHVVVNVVGPIYERKFIYDSYANRVRKGTHRALDRCTQYLRKFKYVLPLDIREYFPSIDHELLLNTLKNMIIDERVINLCRKIISSGEGVLRAEYEMVYYPGDDLFAASRPRGLPIGNMTSQFWANVYLNQLDHFIKRQLKCRGYVRYVDDMLLFSKSKEELHAWHGEVSSFLASLRLKLHENSAQPRPCSAGLPFLGFQVFPDHRRIKRKNAIKAYKHLRGLHTHFLQGAIDQERLDAGVQGWINHARYGDTWGLRKAVLASADLGVEGAHINN